MVIGIRYKIYYFNQYHIEDKRASIQANLAKWEARGTGGETNLNVIDVTQSDQTNSSIVLFEMENEHIGYVHFRKGWNGKYKIEAYRHGGNNVAYQVIKTNHGTYGLLVGKNPDLHIELITAKLMYEEFSFTSNASKEETFLT